MDFVGVRDSHRFHVHSPLSINRDQIRQVVLALRIFSGDAAHRVEQPCELEGVDTRINLADLALGRAGVLLLDNTCNLLAGPDDTSVAAGIVDDCRDHRRRCLS